MNDYLKNKISKISISMLIDNDIKKNNEVNISKFKPLIKLYDRADIINDIA